MSTPKTDIVGQRFGMVIVLESAGSNSSGRALWLCRCDCGTGKVMRGDVLRGGVSRSCGCSPLKKTRTHGMCGTRVYRIWKGVVRRTTKPNDHKYAIYGGRGITLHAPWLKFENFLADMSEPGIGESIDRIDPDGPYSPDNCRWATDSEQRRNQRRSVQLTWHGRTLVVADWAALLGLRRNTLGRRIAAGWPVERALTTGVDPDRLAAALTTIAES